MGTGRVIAYVDGFNLYYGMKSQKLRHCFWLNVPDLLRKYLGRGQELVVTKYFTSRISDPPDKAKRQTDYIEALATTGGLKMFFGQFQTFEHVCRSCAATYSTHREKMTDVNIAIELLQDAFLDRYDAAMLLSADSDLASPLRAVRSLFPQKRLIAIFPPGRGSEQLSPLVHEKRRIREAVLVKSQLPDEVVSANGFRLRRPPEWARLG